MLKLRLKRFGRKKHPSYRIVIIDSKKRRNGRSIAEVGFYDPIADKTKIKTNIISQKLHQGMKATKIVKLILQKYKVLL